MIGLGKGNICQTLRAYCLRARRGPSVVALRCQGAHRCSAVQDPEQQAESTAGKGVCSRPGHTMLDNSCSCQHHTNQHATHIVPAKPISSAACAEGCITQAAHENRCLSLLGASRAIKCTECAPDGAQRQATKPFTLSACFKTKRCKVVLPMLLPKLPTLCMALNRVAL